MKPIKIWGHRGPNPDKVTILMKELGLPYEVIVQPIKEVKSPEYVAINPNGRLPTIEDPNNNGLRIWESGAIFEYLTETYDKDRRISFAPGTPEFWHARQWLYFQTTGQGPYYGQAYFFKVYWPEKLPGVIERYTNEANRVTGVLESWLAKQKEQFGDKNGGPWILGGKMSYVDLAFIPWQKAAASFGKEEYDKEKYPLVTAWLAKMTSRESVTSLEADEHHI